MSELTRVKLSEVASLVDYGHTASSTTEPIGPKFLRITDIQDGCVNWDSVPFCECNSPDEASSQLKTGDIVFARTGATTGKSFLIKNCPNRAIFASYLIRVRAESNIFPDYLAHFFGTPDYWSQISLNARGAAQPGVNATSLKSLSIPLLPIGTQKRIAAILDQAEALRSLRRRSIGQLDALARSVFLEMFGDPVTNPKEWDLKACKNMCSRITVGIVVQPASYYKEQGIPALRSLNIKPNSISKENLVFFSKTDNETKLAKTRLKARDVVLVRTGQPGTAAVVPDELHGINAIDLLITTPIPDVVDSLYLCCFFNSSGGKKLVSSSQVGQIQKHLNVGILNDALIPLPPLALQQEFADRIGAIEALKAQHRESLAKMDTLFASLQHRAFRGEL